MLEILMNGKPVESRLEDEKTLNDVVRSLETWLIGQDQVITGLEIDNERIDPADRLFLMQRPLSSVGRINVLTSSLADLEGESSIEIMRYLTRLETALQQEDESLFGEDAREGVRWVCGSLRLLAGIHHLELRVFPSPEKSLAGVLEKLEKAVDQLDAASSDQSVRLAYRAVLEDAVKVLLVDGYDFLLLVNKRIDGEGDISTQAQQLAEAFSEHAQALVSISADLQTGKETEAMARIQKTVILIEEMMRMLERAKQRYGIRMESIQYGDENLQSWMTRMMETGNSIITAFHDKDTVLLGDLFEYEVSQEFEKIPGYLDALVQALAADQA